MCLHNLAEKNVARLTLLLLTFIACAFIAGIGINKVIAYGEIDGSPQCWQHGQNLCDAFQTGTIIALVFHIIGLLIHIVVFCPLKFPKRFPRGYIPVMIYVIYEIFVTALYILTVILSITIFNSPISLAWLIPFIVFQVLAVCVFIPYFKILRASAAHIVRTTVEAQPTIVQHEAGHIGQPVFIEPRAPTDDVLPQNVPPPAYSEVDKHI